VYKEIADEFGIEVARRFHKNFKGLQINFPMRFLKKEYITRQINEEYNGNNLKNLALKYGYSERWIREIVDLKLQEDSIKNK